MATTFKFGNGNWAVKEDYALAYNDENGNFKPLPFDFTRASSATRVNKDGLIETVPSGKPRIDFTDNTSGHLLLEPSRTNLLTYSEGFDSWSSGGSYVIANRAVSPDGKTTSDELTKTGSFVQIQNSASVSSGADYVFSLFAKKNTTSYITMRIATGSNDVRKYINLDTNETGDSGGNQTGFISTTIEDYSNGWKRISIRVTTGGTLAYCNLYAGQAGNTTYDGEVYIWGSQLEAGSYATSYIPTEGSTVTRSAETANGAGNSTVFNDSEGVLFIECSLFTNSGDNYYFSIGDTTGTRDSVELHFRSEANRIRGIIYSNNSVTINISTYAFNKTNNNKIAFKYKDNDFAIWVNGTEAVTSSSGAAPLKLSNLQFADANNGNTWYGKCKQVLVFNEALTDTELQNLTS